jgi:hypothetical protein
MSTKKETNVVTDTGVQILKSLRGGLLDEMVHLEQLEASDPNLAKRLAGEIRAGRAGHNKNCDNVTCCGGQN